jgi:hypothetical protein
MMQLIGLSKIDGVGSVAEVVAVDALLCSHMSFAGSSCQSEEMLKVQHHRLLHFRLRLVHREFKTKG